MVQAKRLTREEAVTPWVNRALIDLFMAFDHSSIIPLYLFFLEQGIEKMGKAYLLAAQAERYNTLDVDNATYWIESFARNYVHRLSDILGLVGVGIPTVRNWLNDRFIKLLEDAYEEGRYPRPPAKSIFKRHGLAGVVTSRNEEKAFALAGEILDALKRDFGIEFSLSRPPVTSLPQADWKRFTRVFVKKSRNEAAERIALSQAKAREVMEQVISEARSKGVLPARSEQMV